MQPAMQPAMDPAMDPAIEPVEPGRATPTRRTLVRAALGALGAAAVVRGARSAADDEPGLHARARRHGLFYGCEVTRSEFADPNLRAAILRDCGVLVPGNELKWGLTEGVRDRPTFEAADAMIAFATEHGLKVRGHTAVWHMSLPPWVAPALKEPDGLAVMEGRVRDLLSRYRGRIDAWDVLNEAVEPKDDRPDVLRASLFLNAFGPDYVDRAFRVAREAAPGTKLFYNDYGLEYFSPGEEVKRSGTLRLLAGLRRQGIVDGLGIQSHLKVGNNFQPKVFRRFLAEVADLGLDIHLTELDVNDVRLPSDVATRDEKGAEHAARYLDTALDERAVKGVVTWGLSNRYTYLTSPAYRRADGLLPRALPLDEDMKRTPLWSALARALDAAPDRRPG